MPELPEVEVTKMGITPALLHSTIKSVYISDKSLRVPLSPDLKQLEGAVVERVERRAKYIIIYTTQGSCILHLGMTGHLKVLDSSSERVLHDHFELVLDNDKVIRLNDARRFGLVLYIAPNNDPLTNKFLKDLAVEPFSDEFTKEYLYHKLQRKKVPIKQCLMDNHIVVGVGNIYASEVLFKCHISPLKPANKISLAQCQLLIDEIVATLKRSIAQGGTTIRDFSGADGKPGYFVQQLNVYGHAGEDCPVCGHKIKSEFIAQRNTFYCPKCQH